MNTENTDTPADEAPPPMPVAIVVTDEQPGDPPEPALSRDAVPPPKAKPPIVIRRGAARVDAESADIRAIEIAENASLRQTLEQLGTNGAFQITVYRLEPEEVRDPSSGRVIRTSGMLKKYTEVVDEDKIKQKHGGGKYKLQIDRATGKGDQMVRFRQRMIEVAGEPNLDDPALSKLVTASPKESTAPAAVAPESDKLALRAMEMMERQVERQHGAPPTDNKALEILISSLQAQIAALTQTNADLASKLADARNRPPELDPLREKMLDQMFSGNDARLSTLREQHASELRMLKEQHTSDIKRLEDRHDRAMDAQRQSFEREIASMKSTGEIVKMTMEMSQSNSKELLQAQNKALEREISTLREENKDLRNKKDKSPIEMAKDFKAIKDAFGGDEDDEDESTVGKIMGALPDVLPQVGAMFGKGPAAQPPAQPQVQAAPVRQKPQIIQDENGNKFVVRNGKMQAIKPKVVTVPGEPQIPAISPERLAQVVSYLERAFEGGQDAETVAQSAKGMLAGQEDLFQGLRAAGGVDAYLSKVANLPSSSPLASQAGRNWVRKLSKALVGE